MRAGRQIVRSKPGRKRRDGSYGPVAVFSPHARRLSQCLLCYVRRSALRGLLILGICLLLLSSFPPPLTLAATKQQEINNALDDFKDGKFQRSSLSTLVRPPTQGDKLADKVGAVQLGPIGLLKNWSQPQFSLPKALYRMGAAAFGNRIFLIGGFTPNVGSSGSSRVAEVWSTPISLVDGSPMNAKLGCRAGAAGGAARLNDNKPKFCRSQSLQSLRRP